MSTPMALPSGSSHNTSPDAIFLQFLVTLFPAEGGPSAKWPPRASPSLALGEARLGGYPTLPMCLTA
eukprot:1148904-Pelagomonas_calceolata.AAC.6